MQEKRNIRLLVSLSLLISATLITYFLTRTGTELVEDKTIFRVDDFNVIDKVVLHGKEETITLSFDGTRWKANNHTADANMIDVLFATLQQAEPKRPVAKLLQDSINGLLEKSGVKVSLYEGTSLKKEFVTGGNPAKTQAYFKHLGTNKSYLMVIPGYRVYTSGIFELDENGWKDKYVFGFNWRNFQSLKATFPGNPKNNFEIVMGRDYFEVKGLAAVDTTRLNDFLDAVSLTTVNQYLNKNELEDFNSESLPLMAIEVRDVSGKTYLLQLFSWNGPSFTLGMVQGNQPALIDSRKTTSLLKDRQWFEKR
jgi:hypothetical protein